MSASNNLRASRSRGGESGHRRRSSDDPRRSGQPSDPNTVSTVPLRDRGRSGQDDDDAGEDGLFLGFEHRMNTDERRRMRERERVEGVERTRSSSPSGRDPESLGRGSTSSTGLSSSGSARYGSRSSHEPSNKSSTRRSAYARELEKRDRQGPRPARYADDRDRSHRSDDGRRTYTSERNSNRRSATGSDDGIETSERLKERERERGRYRDSEQPMERPSRVRDPERALRKTGNGRSKSRDSAYGDDDDEEERRRRRVERDHQRRRDERAIDDDEERRRLRDERRRRDIANPPLDNDEERRKRREERKLREPTLHERRPVGHRSDDGKSGDECSADLSERDGRRLRNDYRSGDEDTFDRSERERRRAERRPIDYRSGDEDAVDRLERDRRREERRRPREREYGGDRSERIDDRIRSDRDRDRDRERRPRVLRANSSEPEVLRGLDRYDQQRSMRAELGEAIRAVARDRNRQSSSPHIPQDHAEKESSRAKPLSHRTNSAPVFSSRVSKFTSGEAMLTRRDVIPEVENVLGNSTGPSDSSDSSDSECLKESAQDPADDDGSSADENGEKWTVRVCLINAVDLPFNVVPNVPLCPVLKFGLVRIPVMTEDHDETSSGARTHKLAVAEQIEKDGLPSIPKARIRCTSSKILSKRDNGSMEFHEEMRWDNVKHPNQTALAVELCARAALPPTNLCEGPLAKTEESSQLQGPSALALPPLTARGQTWAPSSQARTIGVGLLSGKDDDDYDDIFNRAIGKKGNDDPTMSGMRRISSESDATVGTGLGINRLMGNARWQESEKIDEGEHTEEASQSSAGIAGMRALWRKGRQQFEQRQAAKRKGGPEDAEGANATTAVTRFFIGGKNDAGEGGVEAVRESSVKPLEDPTANRDVSKNGSDSTTLPFGKRPLQQTTARSGEENVALVALTKRRKVEMTHDMRLGSLVIPLAKLPLAKATNEHKAARIEQWYQLDANNNVLMPTQAPARRGLSTASKLAARRNPSVLLEISFSAPEVLDESEDELEVDSDADEPEDTKERILAEEEAVGEAGVSFSRRASIDMKKSQKAKTAAQEAIKSLDDEKKKVEDDPVLAPGVCDFIAVVGAINIGDQSQDNGAKGWVNSNPECAILEQFPPNDDFHISQKRNVTLNNKSEWFCFPEGCRLWRGAEPPSHMDLNLKRQKQL